MKIKLLFSLPIFMIGVLLLAPVALADIGDPIPPPGGQVITIDNPLGCDEATCVIMKIISALGTLIAPVAIVMVLYGAFQFLTSAGDPAKVTAAKNTLLYASIGLIVALVAGSLPYLIEDILK